MAAVPTEVPFKEKVTVPLGDEPWPLVESCAERVTGLPRETVLELG
jgi:hypothetical protein